MRKWVVLAALAVFTPAAAQSESPSDRISRLARAAGAVQTIVACGLRPASWGDSRQEAITRITIEVADENAANFGGKLAARQFAIGAIQQAFEAAGIEHGRYQRLSCEKVGTDSNLRQFDGLLGGR